MDKVYIVIEFERETHEFHEIEGVFEDKAAAETMVEDYNKRFLRYSYECFEEKLTRT